MALLAQYGFLLCIQLTALFTVGVRDSYSRPGAFGCSNFHEAALYRCTLDELLLGTLFGVFVYDAVYPALLVAALVLVVALRLGLRFMILRREDSSRTELSRQILVTPDS